eukprot:3816932-Heterocapsa_arctica.AAC.1
MAVCQHKYTIKSYIGVVSTEKAQHTCSKGMAHSNEYGWGAAAPHKPPQIMRGSAPQTPREKRSRSMLCLPSQTYTHVSEHGH